MERRPEDLLAANYSEDNEYSVQVICQGSCHLVGDDKSTPPDNHIPQVEFKTSVAVQHQSLSSPTRRKIVGYYTSQKFTSQSYQIFSRECCGVKVKKLLDMINIPFSLDNKEFQWSETNDYGTDHQSRSNHDKSLKNSEELVAELVEFFQKIKDSKEQPLCRVEKISVRLSIKRSVLLPNNLYEEWIYWARSRSEEYVSLATCRPAIEMNWRIAAVMTLDGLRIDENDERWSSEICSICMEELSSEAEAIRLVCSHMFHRRCILKWLRHKQLCPNCRASFTMFVPARFTPQIQ